LWDLEEIKKLAFIPGKAAHYKGSNLGKELGSVVAGCFELLVAETLSIKLGLNYLLSCEIKPPPCVVWNGRLTEKFIPICAPRGKPDIEVYTVSGAWVVDATLAKELGVQLAEARRLKHHNPTIPSPTIKRILLTLSQLQTKCEDIEIVEASKLLPTTHPKRGELSYVEEVCKFIKQKCVQGGE
jgi:hypothetical protein